MQIMCATFSEMHRSAPISSTWHPSALIKSSDLKTCVCVDPHFIAPYRELLLFKYCSTAPAFKVTSLLCVFWCMSVFSDDLLSRLKRLLSLTFMHTVISLQQNRKLPVVMNMMGQRKFSRRNRIKLLAPKIFLWTFGGQKGHSILTDHVSVSGDLKIVTVIPLHTVCREGDVIMFFGGRGNAANI